MSVDGPRWSTNSCFEVKGMRTGEIKASLAPLSSGALDSEAAFLDMIPGAHALY